jgi:hypothetical protein
MSETSVKEPGNVFFLESDLSFESSDDVEDLARFLGSSFSVPLDLRFFEVFVLSVCSG